MLRGDEVKYNLEISPYGRPHIVESKSAYVAYADIEAKFRPKHAITVGALVACVTHPILFGKCVKIAKRSRKMHVWIDSTREERTKIRLRKNCVATPSVNEYIRNSDGVWYQVKALQHQFAEVGMVLYSPKVVLLLLLTKKTS